MNTSRRLLPLLCKPRPLSYTHHIIPSRPFSSDLSHGRIILSRRQSHAPTNYTTRFTFPAVASHPSTLNHHHHHHQSQLIPDRQRHYSTAAAAPQQHTDADPQEKLGNIVTNTVKEEAGKEVSEYWGIVPKAWRREDGSPWPWRSFRPQDTYSADISIDVKKHYQAEKWVDKLALWTVKALRGPVDLFFKDRHVSHALLLETVAAVPGMVGGMLLHFKSLRRFEHSGGWIKALLDEAENERMHLMTWVEVLKPNWWERALVLAVQGVFFNGYFLLYIISPRLSHRFVAYLEEEAVHSYTEFLEALDKHEMANGPAPLIAIDYWRLPKDATLRDVVTVVRADEAHHRDVNHFAADVYSQKQELKAAPAPIGYH